MQRRERWRFWGGRWLKEEGFEGSCNFIFLSTSFRERERDWYTVSEGWVGNERYLMAYKYGGYGACPWGLPFAKDTQRWNK